MMKITDWVSVSMYRCRLNSFKRRVLIKNNLFYSHNFAHFVQACDQVQPYMRPSFPELLAGFSQTVTVFIYLRSELILCTDNDERHRQKEGLM